VRVEAGYEKKKIEWKRSEQSHEWERYSQKRIEVKYTHRI
jgi:hypothetical protein